MTRFVPIITAAGTVVALDAHRVKSIAELPDGLCRIWDADETCIDVPGTITGISELLSDPPAGAVRFVRFGSIAVRVDAVVAIEYEGSEHTALKLAGREAPIHVGRSFEEVQAKLEGRAL